MSDQNQRNVNEITTTLACHYWERRGCPHGSREVDRLAAEQALRSSKLTLSGTEVLFVGGNFLVEMPSADRLHRWGFRYYFAGNLKSASDLFSSHPRDLVFCNTRLPGGSGYRLLEAAVDLSKAKAKFSDGTLEVIMPKADPAKSLRVATKPELSSAEAITHVKSLV